MVQYNVPAVHHFKLHAVAHVNCQTKKQFTYVRRSVEEMKCSSLQGIGMDYKTATMKG